VPRITLANPRLTQRHLNSFLLGRFFRSGVVPTPPQPQRMTAAWLFGDTPEADSPSRAFIEWTQESGETLRPILQRLIDPTCALASDEALRASATQLAESRSEYFQRIDAYSKQYDELTAEMLTASARET